MPKFFGKVWPNLGLILAKTELNPKMKNVWTRFPENVQNSADKIRDTTSSIAGLGRKSPYLG